MKSNTAICTNLTLSGLELSVYLGWREAERLQKQNITVDINICFLSPPTACLTDNLDDTVCYNALISHVKEVFSTKRFKLIEHLSAELYQTIKLALSSDVKINVWVKKQPAIANLTDGVTFHYGDDTHP